GAAAVVGGLEKTPGGWEAQRRAPPQEALVDLAARVAHRHPTGLRPWKCRVPRPGRCGAAVRPPPGGRTPPPPDYGGRPSPAARRPLVTRQPARALLFLPNQGKVSTAWRGLPRLFSGRRTGRAFPSKALEYHLPLTHFPASPLTRRRPWRTI